MRKAHSRWANLFIFSGVFSSLSFGVEPKPQGWSINLDQGNGSTEFLAIGRPSALKIVGKGSSPKGRLLIHGSQLGGAATFDLNSLDTGISMRNEHMKTKYLEVQKFPEAKLTLTDLSLANQNTSGDFSLEQVPFKGTLLLHGAEKPVSGTASVVRKSGRVEIFAKFPLKISDFSIPTPGYAGITMAQDVEVSVKSSAPVEK